MTSNSHSKNIFDDKAMCDNCLRIKCVCDEIEREAGFIMSHEGKTSGKYVCRYCKKIPVQCICYENECVYKEEYDYNNLRHGMICVYRDCEVHIPHMIGLRGCNKGLVHTFKK